MIIQFRSKHFQQECNDSKLLKRNHGAIRAKKLRQRLDDISAANTLEDFGKLYPRCHELTGDHHGLISIDLDGQWRLIIKPSDEPPAVKQDGGIDWKNVRSIEVIRIEDTHE